MHITFMFLEMIGQHFKTTPVFHHTILTIGMGESHLAERIIDFEASLDEVGVKLAYLPSTGSVKLNTAQGLSVLPPVLQY